MKRDPEAKGVMMACSKPAKGSPEVGREDALPWDPVLVDGREGLDGRKPFRVLHTADEDAPGHLEVIHRRALGQELGIRQHLEEANDVAP